MDMSSRQISNVLQNGAPVTSQVGAYNTYVGARYVPIFDGEWDSTKQYEPLVIVTNGGDSYTSKQYVPAGTPVTNETFWAHTGNWNGQLESLREQVEENSNMILNNTQSLNHITPIVQKAEIIQKQYWVLLADSYGDTQVSGLNGWTYNIGKYFPDNNYEVHENYGAGFNVSGNTYTMLANQVPVANRNKVTHVLVETAFNDHALSITNFSSAINGFVNQCRNLFPNLQDIIICPICVTRAYIAKKASWYDMFNSGEIIGCRIPEGWISWCHREDYIGSDNVHMTNAGYANLKEIIGKVIYGGNPFGDSHVVTTSTPNGAIENWNNGRNVALSLSVSFTTPATLTDNMLWVPLNKGNNINIILNSYAGYLGMFNIIEGNQLVGMIKSTMSEDGIRGTFYNRGFLKPSTQYRIYGIGYADLVNC